MKKLATDPYKTTARATNMFVSEILQQYSHKSKKDTKDTIALKEGAVNINKKRVLFILFYVYYIHQPHPAQLLIRWTEQQPLQVPYVLKVVLYFGLKVFIYKSLSNEKLQSHLNVEHK